MPSWDHNMFYNAELELIQTAITKLIEDYYDNGLDEEVKPYLELEAKIEKMLELLE